VLRPCAQDAADRRQQLGQLGGPLFQQCPHVRARHRPGTTLPCDLRDLTQREAELSRLGHELQHTQHVSGIDTIPGGSPPRPRHDTFCLVQAQRLARHAAALGHLADEQAVCHVSRIDLAPYGKVKEFGGPHD
jgi:hypothetical protein